jgi:hypothetical protein
MSGTFATTRLVRKMSDSHPAIGVPALANGFHRGRAYCLQVAIDDGSGRVCMRFTESENAFDVLATLKTYVLHSGIPRIRLKNSP